MEIIKVENLSFSYAGFSQKVLDDVSFTVNSGSFNIICGKSGCGKSTLLKCIKHIIAPYGDKSGHIFYYGKDVNETDERVLVTDIGYVSQSPDAQIVTDKVSSELAFGLENIGIKPYEIRQRIAETAYYFGIDDLYYKEIYTLSGGQKQILNLSAVLAMRPKILILDEPTSQLDPISRESFINTLIRLNKDLAMTVIICEHDLENIFPFADRVLLFDDGKLICDDTPIKTAEFMFSKNHVMQYALPVYTRLCHELKLSNEPVISKSEAIDKLKNAIPSGNDIDLCANDHKETAFILKDAFFRYIKNGDDILKGLTLTGYRGEILSVIGGNGCGKTTLLSVLSNNIKIYKGKYKAKNERIALLPQNPRSLFIKSTVEDDISFTAKVCGKSLNDTTQIINSYQFFSGIPKLMKKNPLDLSGGEMQRLAFFKIMLTDPTIILLDEPSKGLDASSKAQLGDVLKMMKDNNICIVLVTHDLEFSAACSQRCAMLFNGEIVSCENPHEFFAANSYYTTQTNKLVKDTFPLAVIPEEVIEVCRR